LARRRRSPLAAGVKKGGVKVVQKRVVVHKKTAAKKWFRFVLFFWAFSFFLFRPVL
jgi:hypothetical protein